MTTDVIPLFPLQSVVLFPSVHVPLHIFEPRYREMTRAALEADRRIGMVTVRPEHLDEMAGNPPIFEVGCEGVIRESRERPDGRYDILLRGTQRFRVREEHPAATVDGRLYRLAEIEPLDDLLPSTDGDRDRVRECRSQVAELIRELVGRIAEERADELITSLARADDVTFVNSLSQSVDFAPVEKQGLLESDSILERFERLRDLMRFRLVDARRGAPGSGETLH